MLHANEKPVVINIRAKSLQQSLIDKAAIKLNKTRSEFMLETSCREAENVLLDQNLFLLDEEQFKNFNDLLNAPISKYNELKSLLGSVSPWEK